MNGGRIERIFTFVDNLENGDYLFRTEHGSLLTEAMAKEELLQMFESARRILNIVECEQMRIVIEVSESKGKHA